MRKTTRFALVLVFTSLGTLGVLATPAGAKVCVDPTRAKCQPTIQAGIDAAVAGETVSIQKGIYAENVQVPAGKDGLRLVGNRGTILDSSADGLSGYGIDVRSNDVVIQRISFQNGQEASILLAGASGTTIRNSTFRGTDDQASCVLMTSANPGTTVEKNVIGSCNGIQTDVGATANNLTVRKNKFRVCTGTGGIACIEVEGDGVAVVRNDMQGNDSTFVSIVGHGAVITRNTMTSSDDDAVVIVGDDALVERNKLTAVGDSTAVNISGSNAVVVRNTIRDVSESAIFVTGLNSAITENQITNVGGLAIRVACRQGCTGGAVLRNRVTTAGFNGVLSFFGGIGIESDGPGFTVGQNVIRNSGSGITVDSSGEASVVENRIDVGGTTTVGSVALVANGQSLVVENNQISDWTGNGIVVTGNGSALVGNRVTGSSSDGIVVNSGSNGVTLSGNVVEDNSQTGIAVFVGATNTTVEGNTALDNTSVDLCDKGSGTTLSDNTYDTSEIGGGGGCPIL